MAKIKYFPQSETVDCLQNECNINIRFHYYVLFMDIHPPRGLLGELHHKCILVLTFANAMIVQLLILVLFRLGSISFTILIGISLQINSILNNYVEYILRFTALRHRKIPYCLWSTIFRRT